MTNTKRSGVLPVRLRWTGCRVKICGITNLSDAVFCSSKGADLLGFVFYKKSPRYIAPSKAAKIARQLPKKILKVGVFVNEAPAVVRRIARACGLDILQFHGDETPQYLAGFRGYRIMKAFRVKDQIEPKLLKEYNADFYLFDAFKKNTFGGTGKTFDWKLLSDLKKVRTPVFISGGLTPKNVGSLLAKTRPFCVDVSSGVEKRPGKKDHEKIEKFIMVAKDHSLPKRS